MTGEQFSQEPDPQLNLIEEIIDTLDSGVDRIRQDTDSARDETVPIQGFVVFNDPSNLGYSQTVARILDFLNQEVFGEPFDPHPAPDEPAPLLYGIVEDGQLVAAASLSSRAESGWRMLSLFGVKAERRGQGLGSKLLKQVEYEAAKLGTREIIIDPLEYSAEHEGGARGFYMRRGYVAHPDDPELIVKTLPSTTQQ